MKVNNFFKVIFAAAFSALAVSCGSNAVIKGHLEGVSDSQVVVKLLDVNHYTVLDTVAVKEGNYTYKVDIEKGNPEFIYIFHNERKIASLLLESGDKVKVSADTLGGNCVVEGSEESLKLQQVEKDFAEVGAKMDRISDEILKADNAETKANLSKKLTNIYIEYYRSRVKYILTNPYSLTVIPVFYQQISEGLPVFSQKTDAIHFNNICDSLETVYPESRYVKGLRKEAQRRVNAMALSERLQKAESVGYPDLALADINGKEIRLSETEGKVVMLHFWNSSDNAQKMFNLEVLKPIYKEFHSRGLEIYAVSLDTDKASWARTVRNQDLSWVNVCDIRGGVSNCVSLYNLSSLPSSFFIKNGSLMVTDAPINDAASLRKFLEKNL